MDLPIQHYCAACSYVGNTRRPLQTLFIRVAGCLVSLGADQRALGGLTPAQCGNYDAHIN
jgi:hypothetical protein